MRPGVDGDVMAGHIGRLEDLRTLDDTGADGEEGSCELVRAEELKDFGRVRGWTVVEGQSPGELVGTGDDVFRGVGATSTSPPAARGISCSGGVTSAGSIDCRGDSENGGIDACDFFHPLSDLGCIGGWYGVLGRIGMIINCH